VGVGVKVCVIVWVCAMALAAVSCADASECVLLDAVWESVCGWVQLALVAVTCDDTSVCALLDAVWESVCGECVWVWVLRCV